MNYFIGIDGGGTKTDYGICDSSGRILATTKNVGSYYLQHTIESIAQNISKNILLLLEQSVVNASDVAGICFGMPGYWEILQKDKEMEKPLKDMLNGIPLLIVNDVEVGWAGSLNLKPGISVASGTGSLGFGKTPNGKTARDGGWINDFGDEGSGYWIGIRGMEIFSKQSDGRLPKSDLYDIVKWTFNLIDDFDFMEIAETEYLNSQEKIASFQINVLEAASQGDKSCTELYSKAAKELADIVTAIATKLNFDGSIDVSYSGGMFNIEEFLLKPFKEYLGSKYNLEKPLYGPLEGAMLLAVDKFK